MIKMKMMMEIKLELFLSVYAYINLLCFRNKPCDQTVFFLCVFVHVYVCVFSGDDVNEVTACPAVRAIVLFDSCCLYCVG